MTTTQELMKIDVPYPDASQLTLRFRLGPCRLRVAPGDGPAWVTGTYDDPSRTLPVDVRVDGDTVTIAQRFDPSAFLAAAALPRLDLAIARARPFALAIETGASENAFDLGGLPITSLDLKAGAGKYDVDFSGPNPTPLTLIDLGAGAGAISARHLANANFAELRVGGGAAGLSLDFSGALRRDASVRVDAGLTALDLTIPATTAARIRTKALAASKNAIGPLERKGDDFYTAPGAAGKTPLLAIEVSMAFGSVTIRAV